MKINYFIKKIKFHKNNDWVLLEIEAKLEHIFFKIVETETIYFTTITKIENLKDLINDRISIKELIKKDLHNFIKNRFINLLNPKPTEDVKIIIGNDKYDIQYSIQFTKLYISINDNYIILDKDFKTKEAIYWEINRFKSLRILDLFIDFYDRGYKNSLY